MEEEVVWHSWRFCTVWMEYYMCQGGKVTYTLIISKVISFSCDCALLMEGFSYIFFFSSQGLGETVFFMFVSGQ